MVKEEGCPLLTAQRSRITGNELRTAAPMTQGLHVIILAAGRTGPKRMKSVLPKVLQPIAGPADAGARESIPPARCSRRPSTWSTATVARRCGSTLPTSPTCSGPSRHNSSAPGHAVAAGNAAGARCRRRCWCCNGDVPLIRAQPPLRDLLGRAGATGGARSGRESMIRPVTGACCVTPRAGSARSSSRRTPPTDQPARAHDQHRNHRALNPPRCGAGCPQLSNSNAQGEYYLTDVFAFAAHEYTPAEMALVADAQEPAPDQAQTIPGSCRSWSVRGSVARCGRCARRARGVRDPARPWTSGGTVTGRQ